MPRRQSRPASAQPPRSRTNGAPPPITVDYLRQRATQMETSLRELQDDFKRTLAQHEREVEALQHEHNGLRDRLDEVRMEECLSPEELAAARGASGGASSDTGRGGAFKLVASSTPAYQQAKALVESKRVECANAEEDLESLRVQLNQLRQERVGVQRVRYSSAVEAYLESHKLLQGKMQVRDLIRVLETHVAQELDKLANMTSDAKALRTGIDAKLVAQTRYEKNYARRMNELLDKKKQMAFLNEVCQTFFDERALATEELRRMHLLADQEDAQFEEAFEELTAVEQQNEQRQSENAHRVQALRQQVANARHERLQLEAKNEQAKREAANGGLRARRSASRDAQEPELNRTARPGGVSSDHGSHTSDDTHSASLDPSTVEGRIALFEDHLNRLSELSGAETAQGVVTFLESSADDRFRCFAEVSTIEEEMQKLEAEKAKLVEVAGSLGVPASEEQAERMLRMRRRRQELVALQSQTRDQEESAAESDLLLEKTVAHIEQMFAGLGCSIAALRSTTGSERVSRATCSEALALVEQRVEEYLIAYSRRQQQLAAAHGPATDSRLFEAARPILRRGDLTAKADSTSAEATAMCGKDLPYSGEVGDDLHMGTTVAPEDRILSPEEMRRIAQKRLAV